MKNEKILIVEDEEDIRALLKLYLVPGGYEVLEAGDAAAALDLFAAAEPDLILLDLGLPDMDGFAICSELRTYSNVPIVILSCRGDSDDVVQGLELGADDYIVKPFDPEVVLARIQANLRRSAIFRRDRKWENGAKEEMLQCDGLEIDLARFQVLLDGKPVPLVTKELQLLIHMAKHPGIVFTLEELYREVWGAEAHRDTRTVIVHLSNLRKKLEPHPLQPRYIHNIRGVGYKFDPK